MATLVSQQLEPVLALSDTLSYIYLLIGIMSLGLTAFPMSPRNNAEATVHLIKQTGAQTIFTNTEDPGHSLVTETAVLLQGDGISLRILAMFSYEELVKMPTKDKIAPLAVSEPVLILHSSGTTAFPKLINITKKGLINLSNIPCYGQLDLTGKRIAAHTNPAFREEITSYIEIQCDPAPQISWWPLSSGAIFAVYNPKPIIPTPANFLASWVADKCDIVFCVPVFIEAWAQDPYNIPKLAALDSIVFSGASVDKGIGDLLENSGVAMHPFWGSTEVGPATMFIPRDPAPKGEWEYFQFSNHITFAMKPHVHLENVFEPIMIPTDICFPHIFNTTYEDKPAFNVGDLLERHPIDSSRWKVYGRTDDQIILSTGENVNPLPIEGIISQDENIAAVIMFGRHQLHTGILVQPAIEQLQNFKNQIWSTIKKANSSAYAQIQKNMIIGIHSERDATASGGSALVHW